MHLKRLVAQGAFDRLAQRIAYPALADGVHPVAAAEECLDHFLVPLRARSLRQDFFHAAIGHGVAVGPLVAHGVVGVGHRQNPGQHRDLLGRQAVGIALAVVPFVVVEHAGQQVANLPQLRQDPVADGHVLLDVLLLLTRERALFPQHGILDADLAHVVQQAGQVEIAEPVAVNADLPANLHGDPGHALAVAEGVWVLGIESGRQGTRQSHQQVLEIVMAVRPAQVQLA